MTLREVLIDVERRYPLALLEDAEGQQWSPRTILQEIDDRELLDREAAFLNNGRIYLREIGSSTLQQPALWWLGVGAVRPMEVS